MSLWEVYRPSLPGCFFAFALLMCVTYNARAQEGEVTEGDNRLPVIEDRDSVRRYFIKGFPDKFFVYPVLKRRSLSFDLVRKDPDASLTYKPNNKFSFGMGMYIFELGIELAFAIPLREQSIERFGESRSRDIGLNILAKRWGVDAFSQNYQGFYVTDANNRPASGEPYPQRRDIRTKNFGFTTYYLFNHQRFSLRSSFNYSERQLISKGSFILLGGLYTFRVSSDSSIVMENQQPFFGPEVDFTRLRYTTFGIAPGYSINLIYKHFFLHTTLAIGPAHHWINYDLEGKPRTNHDITINSFFSGRLAVGYNGYRFFGGISFVSQGSNLRFGDVRFSHDNSVFKVLAGYRFDEFGVLKKRVWDWLPVLGL